MTRSSPGGAANARGQSYVDAVALSGARAATIILRPTVDALLTLIMTATSPEDCHRRLIEFYRRAPPPRELQDVIANGLVLAKFAGLAAHAEAIEETDAALAVMKKGRQSQLVAALPQAEKRRESSVVAALPPREKHGGPKVTTIDIALPPGPGGEP